MNATIVAKAAPSSNFPWPTILLAGVVSATFDLMFAFIFYGLRVDVTPVRILQTIGSGWLGMSSFEGGLTSATLGAVSHYFILIVAAAMYWFASRRLAIIGRHPVLCGVLFGALIYIAMHYVVLPLSAAPAMGFNLVNAGCEFVNHLVLGTIISMIIVRRGLSVR
jgi:uncharacterized membrane protein YagU involved in acid resistance